MATFNAFANGSSTGTTEASALDTGHKAHVAWLELDDDSAFKLDWCAGYVVGMFKLPEAKAREWADMTRVERTAIEVKHAKGTGTAEHVWNAATKAYAYRVVNDSGRVTKADSTKEDVKLSKAQRAAIKACMELGVTMKMFGQGVALLK
jgi:hypothetical protein